MSLSRVLEPEVMDSPQEALDYDTMDHSAVNRQFVDDLLAVGELNGEVLDLGTGTALIPIELCSRIDGCRVMAVDAAVSMLDLARYNVEVQSLIERIHLECIDAKEMPFEAGRFNAVISNSIIHHIPEPSRVLAEAVRVLADDGLLFFRDLMRPSSDAEVSRLVQTYAGQENAHQQKMFDDSLRAALSLREIRELVQQLGFDSQSVRATSDRHWTWSARK